MWKMWGARTKMIDACACMGVRPGDKYCYCELRARGMDTSHYEWAEEEKQRLSIALGKMFGWEVKVGNG